MGSSPTFPTRKVKKMYQYKDAVRYVDKEFAEWSVKDILTYIKNDYWELSRDKIDVQRLNHKAMISLAIEKINKGPVAERQTR